MSRLTTFAALAAAAVSLSACAVTNDLAKVPEPMGRFLLGHSVTVVEEPEIGPFSREATDEAWEEAINFAMEERFGRYDGDKYFHIATKVDGYALAMIGIPVVFTPKSVLVASVTLWDDEKGEPINEPEIFTVSEELSPEALIGTGLTKTADEQMLSLARSLAKSVQKYMLENVAWFGDASLMDPATTSAGKPAPTAGTVPPQFARVKAGEEGAVLEGGQEVGGTSTGVRSETPGEMETTTSGETIIESSS
ncbi:hypothetical protein [Maritimibacter sp. UBA3975]|uniref:hypothetical protein n=1 Tax=Maritimibacter sp. UBA3975 TaxID=1946833 RepID=UPI000C0A0EC0|nr:hypothetical protein [Maritimibacter sp. UBA3975]MAM63772.1 hypothetical protein [Maritimibacter sp.]|tara:strand:- start:223 stop:975 length:753 start_codon:yes stop_codon:yes gene_type:complete